MKHMQSFNVCVNLSVQSANDTNTADDRAEIQKEVNQLNMMKLIELQTILNSILRNY